MTEIKPENIVNQDGLPTDSALHTEEISELDIHDVYGDSQPTRVDIPTAPVIPSEKTPAHPGRAE